MKPRIQLFPSAPEPLDPLQVMGDRLTYLVLFALIGQGVAALVATVAGIIQ